MVMAGEVSADTITLTKPGQEINTDAPLQVAAKMRYVSRGGDKLASVAEALHLDFGGKVVLDVGSSTGGFSDFVLQHGAVKVFAVDVGSNQLAYSLRQDERVVVMERIDIRRVEADQLDPKPDIAVIDVSFISLTKILPTVAQLIKPGGQMVVMAKPQFEADKPTADRYKGVIKDEGIRQPILDRLEASWESEFTIVGAADSAVHGAQGNRERFYLLKAKAV
jgi:23S rRNA (cytidine1920-2'-O)/16S rRNA (cytidine1409-2'-O)-methyltransferase